MLRVLIAFVAFTPLLPAQAPTTGDFLKQVRVNFAAWDADRDGKLTANEIERAVSDPKVTGDAAAAAASLRRGVRGKNIASLTLDELAAGLAVASDKSPKYEAMFTAAQERIRTANRTLFVADPPKLDGLSQGRLGDCFLLASLGSIVHNDPNRLK